MTLVERITAAIQAIGADVKALFTRAVPPGGTAGQVLAKSSGADFATTWVTSSGSGSSTTKTTTLIISPACFGVVAFSAIEPTVTTDSIVSAWLVPSDEFDCEDLSDINVGAEAINGGIIFTVTHDGPIVGNLVVRYSISN